jgi:hypothetical protein
VRSAAIACWSPRESASARIYLPPPTAESRALMPGVWGGDHIRLVISRDRAQLEYDCATGTIDQPIIVDASGKFTAKGSHTPEHGGPRRNGQAAAPRARYIGRVSADTMTLTVTLEAGAERVGVFTLRRGTDPLLTKCR